MKCSHFNICLAAVIISVLLVFSGEVSASQVKVRVKDVASIQGNNNNQLVGYGLVTGLKGTGDKTKVLSNIMIKNMFDNLGMKMDGEDLKKLQTKNTAVCMVTGHLPASFRSGDNIDLTVSSAGDASSLSGGVLVFAALKGPDGKVYASGQGPLTVGADADSKASKVLVGRIPGGGIICRDMDANLVRGGKMTWVLSNPDFKTATRIADAINKKFGSEVASVKGDRFVTVDVDGVQEDPANLAARIGDLDIVPDTKAVVVVNERTGTVIMGSNVKILPVILSHKNLTLKVENPDKAKKKQPKSGELGDGDDGYIRNRLVPVGGDATVKDVIDVLNQMGASPGDLIALLQALKNSGSLQGELIIQ